MSCKKIRKLIDTYLDGELESQQNELIFSHVKTCEKCNSKLNESRKLHKVLTSLSPIKHPSYLHGTIMSRLQTEPCKKKRHFEFPISAWAGVATLIMVIVFSTVLLLRDNTEKTGLEITLTSHSEKATESLPEIYIVSPKENSVVDEQYVDISAVISLDNASNIRVILDGRDVTDLTEIGNDFMIYTSDLLEDGNHKVVINASNKKGKSTIQRSWEFYVVPPIRASISKPSDVI